MALTPEQMRKIDCAIAEKVMGLKDIRMEESWPSQECLVYGFHPHRKCGIPVPEYSTNIAAAWEVVEKMKETYSVCIEKGKDVPAWSVWLIPEHKRGDGFHYIEDILEKFGDSSCSLPHAICLAALKAVGVEVS
jgi:ABA sandwich protein